MAETDVESKICTECYTDNAQAAKFCRNCGRLLSDKPVVFKLIFGGPENKLMGMKDLLSGKTLIPAKYAKIESFTPINSSANTTVPYRRLYKVYTKSTFFISEYGLMNPKGKMIVPLDNYARLFVHGSADLIIAKKSSAPYLSVFNHNGKLWQSDKFILNDLTDFDPSVPIPCQAGYGGKYGYIDILTGKEMLPFVWDYARDFCHGYAGVKQGDKWGVIDMTGKQIVPCRFSNVEIGLNGVFKCTTNSGFLGLNTTIEYVHADGTTASSIEFKKN